MADTARHFEVVGHRLQPHTVDGKLNGFICSPRYLRHLGFVQDSQQGVELGGAVSTHNLYSFDTHLHRHVGVIYLAYGAVHGGVLPLVQTLDGVIGGKPGQL
ncbi:hypothetical protein ES708_28487 [subsurface metagenome]